MSVAVTDYFVLYDVLFCFVVFFPSTVFVCLAEHRKQIATSVTSPNAFSVRTSLGKSWSLKLTNIRKDLVPGNRWEVLDMVMQ